MIASGEKKEEYREIKEYWIKRLFVNYREFWQLKDGKSIVSQFSHINFKNGYSSNAPVMQVEFCDIREGYGKPEWGAVPGVKYFVIKLGKIIK